MKISPKRYIQGFCIVVVALGWTKEFLPSLAYTSSEKAAIDSITHYRDSIAHEKVVTDSIQRADSIELARQLALDRQTQQKTTEEARKPQEPTAPKQENKTAVSTVGTPFKPHRIYSVANFGKAFPDQNDVQLVAAQKYGVKPVKSQTDAEKRKNELVYIGSNPYFYVDRLKSSIPYLVPRASVLLQDIGKTFYDSLQIKGIPLHKIIVTSALRSRDDVVKLQKRNQNATTNSCHQYGTTIDICYNRYKTVENPNGPKKRAVTNDTLKWVLSEVLNDFRKNDRCYIKYEVHQGCFHITVK